MNWDDVAFVKASKMRERILRSVKEKPLGPKELTQSLRVHFSQVSLALKELTAKGLIENLTENRTKGRLYGITKAGVGVLDKW